MTMTTHVKSISIQYGTDSGLMHSVVGTSMRLDVTAVSQLCTHDSVACAVLCPSTSRGVSLGARDTRPTSAAQPVRWPTADCMARLHSGAPSQDRVSRPHEPRPRVARGYRSPHQPRSAADALMAYSGRRGLGIVPCECPAGDAALGCRRRGPRLPRESRHQRSPERRIQTPRLTRHRPTEHRSGAVPLTMEVR